MTALQIILNGDGAFPGLDPDQVLKAKNNAEVVLLHGGTSHGQHSVGVMITLDDGKKVWWETTANLWI